MKISLIAALSENRVIGRENRLPWSLPEDLQRFRELTTGHPVILGRKTYESIGRVLPKRQNIIITRNRDYRISGAEVVGSLDEAIARADASSGEIFIIGGAEIYQQALPRADRLYLTLVHAEVEGDAFFPEWPRERFVEVSREERKGPDHPVAYTFLVFDRR
jgi:dihydrofolate reductase